MSLTNLAQKLEEQKKLNADTLEGINRVGDGVEGLNKNFTAFLKSQDRNKFDQLEAQNKKLQAQKASSRVDKSSGETSRPSMGALAQGALGLAAGAAAIKAFVDKLDSRQKTEVKEAVETVLNPLDQNITLSIAKINQRLNDIQSQNSEIKKNTKVPYTTPKVSKVTPTLKPPSPVTKVTPTLPKPIPKVTVDYQGKKLDLTKNVGTNTFRDATGKNYSVKNGKVTRLTGGADAMVVRKEAQALAPPDTSKSAVKIDTTTAKPLVADPTKSIDPNRRFTAMNDERGRGNRYKNYGMMIRNRVGATAFVAALNPVEAAAETAANVLAKAQTITKGKYNPLNNMIGRTLVSGVSIPGKTISAAFKIAGSVPGAALQMMIAPSSLADGSIDAPMIQAAFDMEKVAADRGKGAIAVLLAIQKGMKDWIKTTGGQGMPQGEWGVYCELLMKMSTEELKTWAQEKHFFRFPEKAPGFDPDDYTTWDSYKQIMDYNVVANEDPNDGFLPIENLSARRLEKMAGRGLFGIRSRFFRGSGSGKTRIGTQAYAERGAVNDIVSRLIEGGTITQSGDTYIFNGGDTNTVNGSASGGGSDIPPLPPQNVTTVTNDLTVNN